MHPVVGSFHFPRRKTSRAGRGLANNEGRRPLCGGGAARLLEPPVRLQPWPGLPSAWSVPPAERRALRPAATPKHPTLGHRGHAAGPPWPPRPSRHAHCRSASRTSHRARQPRRQRPQTRRKILCQFLPLQITGETGRLAGRGGARRGAPGEGRRGRGRWPARTPSRCGAPPGHPRGGKQRKRIDTRQSARPRVRPSAPPGFGRLRPALPGLAVRCMPLVAIACRTDRPLLQPRSLAATRGSARQSFAHVRFESEESLEAVEAPRR